LDELVKIGIPSSFSKTYGFGLVTAIKTFLNSRNLQSYVQRKALSTRPSVNASAPNTSTAARTSSQQIVNTAFSQNKNHPPIRQSQPISSNHQTNSNLRQGTETTNLPDRERWSEKRIDDASTVEELEKIRHRMLTLLNRANARLKKMGLVGALKQINEVAEVEDIDGLSTQQLMDRLNKEVEKSTSTNDCELGSDENPSLNEGKSADGKRTAEEATADTEIADKGSNKRPCLSAMCPLCFEKAELPGSSTNNCEVCEESNICKNCHLSCTCCGRSICVDCLMGCNGCGSGYHCSDCMMQGGGKCVDCRKKNARRTNASTHHWPMDGTLRMSVPGLHRRESHHTNSYNRAGQTNTMASTATLRLANELIGYPRHPLTSVPRIFPRIFPRKLPTFPQQQFRSHVSQNQAPSSYMEQTVAKPSEQPNPSRSGIGEQPAPKLYSIHRFILSEPGLIGINITLQQTANKCIVSNVHQDSVALRHGVKVGDEILPAYPTAEAATTYKLFLAAAKNRPIMFEVKRPYTDTVPNTFPSQVSVALHRFVITQYGRIGINIFELDGVSHIKSITPNSLGHIHGLREKDIICMPNTNGAVRSNVHTWFIKHAKGGVRPFVIEVLRVVPSSMAEGLKMCQKSSDGNQNPFLYSFEPKTHAPEEDKGDKEAHSKLVSQRELEVAAKAQMITNGTCARGLAPSVEEGHNHKGGNASKGSFTDNNTSSGERRAPIILLDDDSDSD